MSGTRKEIEICYDTPTGRTTMTSWTDVDTECYWTLLDEVEVMLGDENEEVSQVSVRIDREEVFTDQDWEM